MSIHNLNLAFKSEIQKSSLKFILVALADYANEDSEAYPSIETITRKTSLNRKTIQSGLVELVNLGYIEDTNQRRGRTKSVKIWRLTIERPQKRDDLTIDPKNGTAKRSQKRDIEPPLLLTTSVTKKTNKKEIVFIHLLVADIFEFWCNAMGKKSACLTNNRDACIKSRLREGYLAEDIKTAITNCSKSDYHMGQNDSATIYNDITLICRSGEKLEWFRDSVGAGTKTTNGAKPKQTAPDFSKMDYSVPDGWNVDE